MPLLPRRSTMLPFVVTGALLAVPVLPTAAHAATGTTPLTYAGGAFGDGGPATSARLATWLGGPAHVAVDGDGNIYIPDSRSHEIRRVDAADGTVTRYAGSGAEGSGGDGGPASEAPLTTPVAVAFAPDGALLVADSGTGRIRRIDADGTISTLATGLSPSNVYAAADGTVYVTDAHAVLTVANGTVTVVAGHRTEGGFGGDGGPATDAYLEAPQDVVRATDGTLYIADGNGRVRMVDPNGTISTVAGAGTTHFGGDEGNGGPATAAYFAGLTMVALGDNGTIFAGDSRSGVRAFTVGGTISVVAPLSCGGAIEREPAGTYLVRCDNDVHRVAADGSTDTVVAGTATGAVGDGMAATDAALDNVAGLAADGDGNLYIAEGRGGRIRRVGADGIIHTVAGSLGLQSASSGDGGPATDAVLVDPREVAVAPDGTFYIADGTEHTVRRVGTTGTITTMGTYTGTPALAVSGDGVDVANLAAGLVIHVAANGTPTVVAGGGTKAFRAAEGGAATDASLAPRSIARDAAGRLLVLSGQFLYTIDGGVVQTVVRVGDAQRVGVDGAGRVLLQSFGQLELLAPDGSGSGLDLPIGQGSPPGWAVLADGRVAWADDWNVEPRVLVRTPSWAARPPQATGVWVENVATPPVLHWTAPAGWGDAIVVPVVRKGTIAARTVTDGFDERDYAGMLPFTEEGGVEYGQTYTVAVFSFSPSLSAWSAPVVVTYQPRIPPPAVTGFKAGAGLTVASLRWTNPPSGITGVFVRMATGSTPPTATSGTQTYSGTGDHLLKGGLAEGTSYSFSVFTRNAAGDVSAAVSRTLTGTTLTVHRSASLVSLKAPVTLSGTLRAANGVPLSGEAVEVRGRIAGTSTWTPLGYPTTTSTGTYSFVHHPSFTTTYQVRFRGVGALLGTSATTPAVSVRSAVTAVANSASIALGQTQTIHGSVAPVHAGKQLTIQRYYGGAWHSVGYATLSATSTYAWSVKPVVRGTYYYRVVNPADTAHATGISPTVKFAVV